MCCLSGTETPTHAHCLLNQFNKYSASASNDIAQDLQQRHPRRAISHHDEAILITSIRSLPPGATNLELRRDFDHLLTTPHGLTEPSVPPADTCVPVLAGKVALPAAKHLCKRCPQCRKDILPKKARRRESGRHGHHRHARDGQPAREGAADSTSSLSDIASTGRGPATGQNFEFSEVNSATGRIVAVASAGSNPSARPLISSLKRRDPSGQALAKPVPEDKTEHPTPQPAQQATSTRLDSPTKVAETPQKRKKATFVGDVSSQCPDDNK
ncbi:uncharacterized protein LOC144159363 [Haemaphysalis longicornis]